MIPTFFQWLEAIVPVKNINNAIKQSIEFIVGGKWETNTENLRTITNYPATGPVGSKEKIQTCYIWMSSPQPTGYFFVNIRTEIRDQLAVYDSKMGNDKIKITAHLLARSDTNPTHLGGFKKIDTGYFSTPLDLAKWIKAKILSYEDDDGDTDSGEYTPDPTLEPELAI